MNDFKKKFITRLLFIGALCLITFSTLIYFSYRHVRSVQRDVPTLIKRYMQQQSPNFEFEHQLLGMINAKNTTPELILELNRWYLERGAIHSSLALLGKADKIYPENVEFQLNLIKSYGLIHHDEKAKKMFFQLFKRLSSDEKKELLLALPKFSEYVRANGFAEKKNSSLKPSTIEPLNMKAKTDLSPLLNTVYSMEKLNPAFVLDALKFIINTEPDNERAQQMIAYYYLKKNNYQQALFHFRQAFQLKKRAEISAQIAHIYVQLKQYRQAQIYFEYALLHGDETIKLSSKKSLIYLKELLSPSSTKAIAKLSQKNKLLLRFYAFKEQHPHQAWSIIEQLMKSYPDDLTLLKEAAYFASGQKRYRLSIRLWHALLCRTQKADFALPIAYAYSALGRQAKAYFYFDLASRSEDEKLSLKAEVAKTNLGGSQTQFLPAPFFAEIYTSPFYFSRFDLSVLPLISRFGIMLDSGYNFAAYLSYRRTQDNQSNFSSGQFLGAPISQLFEDNVAITAFGVRINPWKDVPIGAFFEAGRAEDLVYRNRPRWRNDFRGGAYYANYWGMKPTYSPSLDFPFDWASTLYSDAIFYSRYDNNIISGTVFRPGVRLATYRSSSMDAYVANYLILDKNREFFNNTFSIGPGIRFIPTNRINLAVRLESLQGFYLPIHSRTPNPYKRHYYNTVGLVEFFGRF